MNNELPRTIEDVPFKHAYEGKKIWTILDDNKRLVGTLHLNDANVSLEFEVPREEVDGFRAKLLKKTTGIAERKSRITLIDASAWESMFSGLLKTGPGKMVLSPSLVVVQPDIKSPVDHVTNITGYLPGIGEWFKEDFLGFDHAEYKFKQPKTIYHEIPLGSFAVLILKAKLTISTDGIIEGKFVAYPESFARIEFQKPTPVSRAIDVFSYVENFFNFIFSAPHATHIFTSEVTTTKPHHTPLYILSPKRHKDYQRLDKRFGGSMLFSWEDVSNIDDVFVNWVLQYERIHEIVDTLVLMKSTRISEEMRFTSIVNALESVHRRYYDHKTESDEEYKQRVESITEQIKDDDDKSFVRGRLQYGNEISLRARLKEVYAIGEQHGISRLSKATTDKIIETRNYYVHGDEARKKRILQSDNLELHYANTKLGMYLKLILLQNIGVNPTDLANIVKNSHQFSGLYRDGPPTKNPYIF